MVEYLTHTQKRTHAHNIYVYKASVSAGWKQQIMPNLKHVIPAATAA